MSAIKPKYDFYENAAFLDDPLTADIVRKPKAIAHKIGTEPRVRPIMIYKIFIDAIEHS
jgi:hypothetical protein